MDIAWRIVEFKDHSSAYSSVHYCVTFRKRFITSWTLPTKQPSVDYLSGILTYSADPDFEEELPIRLVEALQLHKQGVMIQINLTYFCFVLGPPDRSELEDESDSSIWLVEALQLHEQGVVIQINLTYFRFVLGPPDRSELEDESDSSILVERVLPRHR